LFFKILPPGIILDKCANLSSLSKGIAILNRKGFKYAVLDEEGIHTFYKEVLERIGNPIRIDLLFFNNKFQYLLTKRVIKKLGFKMPRYRISGNPRLLNNFLEDSSKIKKKIKKIYVIGNHNFVYGTQNFLFSQDRPYKEIIMKFLDDYVTTENKNFLIYYRPHPSENNDIIDFCIKNGVILDSRSSIQKIAQEADIVITNRCTVSIQCQIFNKSINIFSFYDYDSRNIFTRAGTIRFDGLESLKFLINKYLYQNIDNPPRIKKERERVLDLFSCNQNPIENIGTEISKINENVPSFDRRVLLIRVLIGSFISNFMNLILIKRLKMRYKIDKRLIKKAISKKLIHPTFGFIYF